MFPPIQIKFRHTLAVIPAFIFWAVSLVFFVMGLSMDDHTGYLLWIGVGLAGANTIVQMIGWDSDPDELGPILYWSWMASYVLGIGTNVVSLLYILQINNVYLEWIVSIALSFMIEVTPERLFVLAWRSVSPKNIIPERFKKNSQHSNKTKPAIVQSREVQLTRSERPHIVQPKVELTRAERIRLQRQLQDLKVGEEVYEEQAN